MKQRIEYIDALKGLAIFLVLWGHSLQYLKNGNDFFHNPMFEFIYSFHMPLFFMISGFFFKSSLNDNFKSFIIKKSIQLILPCIVWAFIGYLINFSGAIIKGNEQSLSNWFGELKVVLYPNHWNWFLKELFISYLITYLSIRILKKEWLACILSIILVICAPYCDIQRVLLPIFWIGILLKNNYNYIFESNVSKTIILTSGLIFIICLLFWDGDYTMYVTPAPRVFKIRELKINFTNLNIGISIFRFLIGVVGSLFWFLLFDKLYSKNKLFLVLSKIGTNTLAIYLLQRIILENYINRLFDFPNANILTYDFFITPIISLTTLAFCILIIKIIQKNEYVDLFLFGRIPKLWSAHNTGLASGG